MVCVTQAAEIIHSNKYRAKGETFRDFSNRVANGLKDSSEHYHVSRGILYDQRFCFGGRVNAAIGLNKFVTASNCFVSGTILDSYVDGEGNIMQRATESAATMRMGGGMGYNFTTLRPRNSLIKKLNSRSSGPVSFMQIYNSVGIVTSSTDERRGAQMGILNVNHPDIKEFINCKHDNTSYTGFNLSIGMLDDFMEAVDKQATYKLTWGGQDYEEVDACELFEMIMRSTWDFAEPGIVFLDTINRMNNLYYCEKIEATNPCQEQGLPPFGACLLGSWILPKYLRRQPIPVMDMKCATNGQYYYSGWSFDYEQLIEDIPHCVRMADNVIDRSFYPLIQQQQEQQNKRRMGLGIAGLANCCEAMGMPYGSKEFLEWEDKICELITHHCYIASAKLAEEKGAFPLFDKEKYLAGNFIKTLDDEVHWHIGKHGMRNSHLTSIAPNGTMSLTCDNITGGVEPMFWESGDRPIRTANGVVMMPVEDYGIKFLGVRGKQTNEVSINEHIDVLLTAQKHIDSSISKTINCHHDTTPWEDFKNIYKRVWEGGGKGCSTFVEGGKREALLKRNDVEDRSCKFDGETGMKECS